MFIKAREDGDVPLSASRKKLSTDGDIFLFLHECLNLYPTNQTFDWVKKTTRLWTYHQQIISKYIVNNLPI